VATVIGLAVILYLAIDKLYDSESNFAVDHLLDDKAFVTIYFCLIKYHRGNVIEVILEKATFLKKLLKNI
jgi:hypothetical protein